MTKTERIKAAFQKHNNVLSTAELTAYKIYYADIQKLLDEGLIEKVRRGFYHWIDQSNSAMGASLIVLLAVKKKASR